MSKINLEDMMETLKQAGIDPDKWMNVEERQVASKVLLEQQNLLNQMSKMLSDVVENDKKKVRELREQVARIKHGGGC